MGNPSLRLSEVLDRFSLNFIYAFILIRSSLGLLHVIFCTFIPELWPLVYAKKIVSAQYLDNKLTDFSAIFL